MPKFNTQDYEEIKWREITRQFRREDREEPTVKTKMDSLLSLCEGQFSITPFNVVYKS